MFDPMTVPIPPQAPVTPIAPVAPSAPILPPPAPPLAFKVEKPNKNAWNIGTVRRAQGIYPAEAQAKANQVANAKMPTPTGAWGAPQ